MIRNGRAGSSPAPSTLETCNNAVYQYVTGFFICIFQTSSKLFYFKGIFPPFTVSRNPNLNFLPIFKFLTNPPGMKTFRWIAVLPVAILAFAFSSFVLNFGFNLFSNMNYAFTWEKTVFIDILAPAFSSAYLVYAGILTAPSFKKETGIILTILCCMLYAVSLFIVYFVNYDYASVLPAVAGILGSTIYCLYFLRTGINDIKLGADF